MKSAHDLVLAAKARIIEIPVAQVPLALVTTDAVLDVREADEFAAGHLPGALHISRGMLEFKLSAMPALANPDLKLLIYCKTGGRSALAAAAMQDMGYTNVLSMAGGFDAWAAAGNPVQQPQLPSFD